MIVKTWILWKRLNEPLEKRKPTDSHVAYARHTFDKFPASIYLHKVKNRTLGQGMKYDQS